MERTQVETKIAFDRFLRSASSLLSTPSRCYAIMDNGERVRSASEVTRKAPYKSPNQQDIRDLRTRAAN
eukprot:4201021-Pyramimonas_sp.AAC.3